MITTVTQTHSVTLTGIYRYTFDTVNIAADTFKSFQH